jgi:hypothetical protein
LESEQFKIVGNEKPDLDTLRKAMHELMKSRSMPRLLMLQKRC